jgi:hypothetical protein
MQYLTAGTSNLACNAECGVNTPSGIIPMLFSKGSNLIPDAQSQSDGSKLYFLVLKQTWIRIMCPGCDSRFECLDVHPKVT